MPIPLPSAEVAVQDHLLTSAEEQSLYCHVLQAEQQASQTSAAQDLVAARVVGYILLYPISQNRMALAREVASCHREEDYIAKIYELGQLYMLHIVTLFKSHRARTPAVSDRPSRQSFEALCQAIQEQLQLSPRDHRTTKQLALIRDNFRCMVTGDVDINSLSGDLVNKAPDEASDYTQCCYILPETLSVLGTNDTNKKTAVATAWAMLNRFGYADIQKELIERDIHRLENVLTLALTLHMAFDALHLWFEAVDGEAHLYNVKTVPYFNRGGHLPSQVRFVAQHNLPLPDPRYLAIHAACCRIALMSGAAEYVRKIYTEEEELGVLATDGNSASVLGFLLHRLVDPV